MIYLKVIVGGNKMIAEICNNINKIVTITLTNGREKIGKIVRIDIEANTVSLRDENNIIFSILISMIGMFEPLNCENKLNNQNLQMINNTNVAINDTSNSYTEKITEQTISSDALHKLIKIENIIDVEIINAKLQLNSPNLETPKDILDADGYSRQSGLKIWNWILDKYNHAKKNGTLAPNSDDLKAIIDKTNKFFEISTLSNSSVLYSYLGYFSYINSDKDKSIEAYTLAAKLSNNPKYWLMLAAVASEKKKNEIACYALEKFFLQSNCSEEENKKAWYKFAELIIKFSSYNSYKEIINNTLRLLSKEELKKIFEIVCYFLIKNNQQEIAKIQIQNSLTNYNYKKLSLDCLEILPKYKSLSYDNFIYEFESSQTNNINKNNLSNTSMQRNKFVSKQYIDYLLEAKHAREVEKNYEKAEDLFIKGIESEKDSNIKERAVRGFAGMLAQQMNQPVKAIQTIHKYQSKITESDLNLLYDFHYQSGKYEDAIKIQKELLKNTITKDVKFTRIFKIAACCLKKGSYKMAEKEYRNALELNPTHNAVKRYIALCLYKQGTIKEAKNILEKLITNFNDLKSKELLNNIENKTAIQIDDIIIDTAGLVYENIDDFTRFYLSTCDLKFIGKNKLSEEGKYIGNDKENDIKKLIDTANALRSGAAEERSIIYLNIAKILFDSEEKNNNLYQYLCRSFNSKGDNAVQSGNSLDTVKTFYLAALKANDSLFFDENQYEPFSAVTFSLCRLLYSTIGSKKIPLFPVNIEETIEAVFEEHPEPDNIFDALSLIFARSPQFSINRLAKIIFEVAKYRKLAINYLKTCNKVNYDNFIELWKNKAREIINDENELSETLFPLNNFEFVEKWLLLGIERINKVISKVIFESDKNYLNVLLEVFDLCISLSKINSQDEKINKCDEINNKAANLMTKIEKNPTKLSIELIHPTVKKIIISIEYYLNNLNQSSKPELNISSSISSYYLKENQQIDLQIKIKNNAEGHAYQVELMIEKDNNLYDLINPQAISYRTIRGYTHETQIITLQIKPEAVSSKAFTLKAFAKFRTWRGEEVESLKQEISIQLGDVKDLKDFKEINPNPYTKWVRAGKVTDKSMFFGREEFIHRAYNAVCNSYKSYVIYGQFRSGKSSILHHLEKKLNENPQILVVKIDDIGRLLDDNSTTPILYQILHAILKKIHSSIILKKALGFPLINFQTPNSLEFYNHPAPLNFFYEFLDLFNEEKEKYTEWKNVRVIITIDEFTYLYEKIVQGKLSQDFMKNWKALLSLNYFNVVLVGQDVFPKFRNQFDNAFQTMEHERVTYLNKVDAKALIDQPIQVKIDGIIKSRYTEKEAIDRICELTACSPYYIQIFCNQLVEYINNEKQQYITKANVNIVKDRLLRGDKRLDKTAFTNLINNGDPASDATSHKDLVYVLKKIAENTKNDSYCIKRMIRCEAQSDISDILKDLEERDVIEKHGEKGFRIRVGLFKEWLNENPDFEE